jgi:hypothetical protein
MIPGFPGPFDTDEFDKFTQLSDYACFPLDFIIYGREGLLLPCPNDPEVDNHDIGIPQLLDRYYFSADGACCSRSSLHILSAVQPQLLDVQGLNNWTLWHTLKF